jgi:hypothetical protein
VDEGVWQHNFTISIRDASSYSPAGVVTPRNPPASPQSIGEALDYINMASGIAPGTCYIADGTMVAQGWHKQYVGMYVQLSSNWIGDNSTENKVFISNIHGDPCGVLSAQGAGSGTMNWRYRLQNLGVTGGNTHADGTYNVPGNGANDVVTRGLWQLVEAVLTANTPGSQNGRVQIWVTNFNSLGQKVSGPTLTTDRSDIGWSSMSQSNIFGAVSWNPIWGGNSGTKILTVQYMWMDQIRVAGAV